ncbi:hypothetical protein J7K18_05310 [bacterium]|nr:hypothetical protein [bacterium]
MKKMSIVLMVLAVLISIAYWGCSKKGIEPSQNDDIYINCGLFLPDSIENVELEEIIGSKFIFTYSGNPPDVRPGYVMACSDSYGFLRKVTGVQFDGNSMSLETSPIALTEFMANANLEKQFTIEISPSLLRTKPNAYECHLEDGIEIIDGGISINDFVIYPPDDDPNPPLVITINGQLLFEPSYDIGFTLGWFTLDEFHATVTGQLSFDASAEVTAYRDWSYVQETTIFSLVHRQWIGFAGPIPIWAKVSLTFDMGVDFNSYISGYATTGFEADAEVEVGARYIDGGWHEIWHPFTDFTPYPFEWEQDADLMCRVYVRPTVSIELDDIAGPYLYLEPFLKANAEVHDFTDWNWALTAGADAALSFRVHLLTLELADYNTNILSIEETLATGSSEFIPDTVIHIITPEQMEILEELGLEINPGSDPPNIEGEYFISPLILIGSSIAEDVIGSQFADYYYNFFNQTEDYEIEVNYHSEGYTDVATGVGSFISGSGSDFSVFLQIEGEIDDSTDYATYTLAKIVSGTISASGIIDCQIGFILTDKYDPDDILIEINDARVFEDSDGLANRIGLASILKKSNTQTQNHNRIRSIVSK